MIPQKTIAIAMTMDVTTAGISSKLMNVNRMIPVREGVEEIQGTIRRLIRRDQEKD